MPRYSKRSRPSRRNCEVLSIRNEVRSDAVRSALVWRGYADPVASKQIADSGSRALEVAAQAVEAEFDGTQAHPVAAAVDA